LQKPRLVSGLAFNNQNYDNEEGIKIFLITNYAPWRQKLLSGFLEFHKMFGMEILKLR
jgi:hypothetical protein